MNLSRRITRSVERGITWLPRHDSYYVVAGLLVSSREVDPLCVTQAALLAVEGSLVRAGAAGGYGLLTGQLCTCPRTRQHYVLVEGVRECPPLPDTDDVYGQIAFELGARILEVERSGRVAVGCYLADVPVVPQPSARDVGLLRMLFPLPWQAMLLRDREGAGHGGIGAFVRIEPMNVRAYAAPFVELLPTGRRRVDDPPRSAVGWSNYHPTEPVAEQALTAGGADGPAEGEAPIGRRVQQRILSAMDGLMSRRRPDRPDRPEGGQGRDGSAGDRVPVAPAAPATAPIPAPSEAWADELASAPPPLAAPPQVARPATSSATSRTPTRTSAPSAARPAPAAPPQETAHHPTAPGPPAPEPVQPSAPRSTPAVATAVPFPALRVSFTPAVALPAPVAPQSTATAPVPAPAPAPAPPAAAAAADPPTAASPVEDAPASIQPNPAASAAETAAPAVETLPMEAVVEVPAAAPVEAASIEAPAVEAPAVEMPVVEMPVVEEAAAIVPGLADAATDRLQAAEPVVVTSAPAPPAAEPTPDPVRDPVPDPAPDPAPPAASTPAPAAVPEPGQREDSPEAATTPAAPPRRPPAATARETGPSSPTFPLLVPVDEQGGRVRSGRRRRLAGGVAVVAVAALAWVGWSLGSADAPGGAPATVAPRADSVAGAGASPPARGTPGQERLAETADSLTSAIAALDVAMGPPGSADQGSPARCARVRSAYAQVELYDVALVSLRGDHPGELDARLSATLETLERDVQDRWQRMMESGCAQ